jgi:hypothetical protein
MVGRLCDYCSPIAAPNKHARSVVQFEDALRGSPVLLEAIPRLLEDADLEAVLDKNVINASPI